MTVYVALLRGIMPMNPNMRNEKLRTVFESLGFKKVRTVIASGNVLFETRNENEKEMEKIIEFELKNQLNINCPTFIRSQKDLIKMITKDPFKGGAHSRATYLIVTFLKKKPFEIYSTIDTSGPTTPEFMRDVERQYGKEITTRTWKTVQKILTKMNTV